MGENSLNISGEHPVDMAKGKLKLIIPSLTKTGILICDNKNNSFVQ